MSPTTVTAVVVVIAAICQAIKYTGIDTKWIPLLSVVLGLISGIYFGGADFLSATSGIVLGLSTSGLYDLVKKTALNQ